MRWVSSITISALLGASFFLQQPQAAAPSGNGWPVEVSTLAWVDADSITTNELAELLSTQRRPTGGGEIPQLSTDGVLKRLIQNRLLEHEGYRLGAPETPQVRNQVWELVRHRSMLALLDSVSADARETEPAELGPALDRTSTMHRVSHMLLEDEASAAALLDSLTAGVPFAELARRHSLDTANSGAGGDLGWARADLYIPEFQKALQGVSKGEVAGPVKTDKGWHLLELTDTRTETVGQSEEMREQLENAATTERVMKTVRSYVESLKEKYGVVVNDSLLATLDYASADPEVKSGLKQNEAVLVALPWRNLTVTELTNRIRFEYFHGTEGKADAAEIRDRVLDEWVTELLLRHEASVLGFDKKPEIVAAADQLERELLREFVVNMILDFPFDPGPEEVADYYAVHADAFRPVPRVRAEGAHLADAESARDFREKVDAGAQVNWLADRAPGVLDPKPAMFADWIELATLGLSGSEVEKGLIIGPVEADGVWVVARIVEVESAEPAPLEKCRNDVVATMKRERIQETMKGALARLESEATIDVADDAHDTVATWIAAWLGTSNTSSD